MKKLLLLSAITAGMLTASAQSVADLYKVTYQGQEIENGATVASSTADEMGAMYKCDVLFTLKNSSSSGSLSVLGSYTDNPTYEMAMSDYAAWGAGSVCWGTEGNSGLCPPAPQGLLCDFTTSVSNTPQEIQFHLQGSVEIPDDFDPNDPSSPQPGWVLPKNNGLYKIEVSATVDGTNTTAPFVYYMLVGPTAASVEGVELDNDDVPSVFYDLQGRRIINPAKGQIVIERKGSKAVKRVL